MVNDDEIRIVPEGKMHEGPPKRPNCRFFYSLRKVPLRKLIRVLIEAGDPDLLNHLKHCKKCRLYQQMRDKDDASYTIMDELIVEAQNEVRRKSKIKKVTTNKQKKKKK